MPVLGQNAKIPNNPNTFELDVINWNGLSPMNVRFTIPEFTSLCPVTGQPDFATIVIDYQPHKLIVESKSLKLFMFSFRNHAAFHEVCVHKIAAILGKALSPHWLRVVGYFNPRGGIPIDVTVEVGTLQCERENLLPLPRAESAARVLR